MEKRIEFVHNAVKSGCVRWSFSIFSELPKLSSLLSFFELKVGGRRGEDGNKICVQINTGCMRSGL